MVTITRDPIKVIEKMKKHNTLVSMFADGYILPYIELVQTELNKVDLSLVVVFTRELDGGNLDNG